MGMDAYDIRLANVRALIDSDFEGNQAAFARTIGREPNYVSRWFTDTLHRKRIGERLAREIEEKLRLPPGRLDVLSAPRDPLVVAEQTSLYGDDTWLRSVPVVGTAQLGDDGYWDELQHPTGSGDGFVRYPTRDTNAYALRVKGDSMRPRIRPGEFVIIEPNTNVEPGDEVLVKTKDGRSMVKVLASHRNGLVELRSINEDHAPITLDESAIDAMHYVGGIVKAGLYRHI
jgi:phage repressor protein C with HTH and peptisase S24 domain